jgi:hypothetical protein
MMSIAQDKSLACTAWELGVSVLRGFVRSEDKHVTTRTVSRGERSFRPVLKDPTVYSIQVG